MSSRAGRRASGSAIASRSSSRSASLATTMIARCRGSARPRRCEVESRVLSEDRLLELLEGRARLDPELVDEQPPGLAVDLERLGLATGAVEREHELRASRSRNGCSRTSASSSPTSSAWRPSARSASIRRSSAARRSSSSRGISACANGSCGEVGERRAAPEVERLAEESRRALGRRRLRLLDEPLEAQQVELVRLDRIR